MITIDYAHPDAREEVAQFMCRCFPRARWGIDRWRTLLDGRWAEPGDSFAITVRDGDELVGAIGMINALRMTHAGRAKTISLTSWYLLKPYRAQGIGRRMLELASSDPEVAVTNLSSARAAVPLVEKAGFQVLDDTRLIWQPDETAAQQTAITDRDRLKALISDKDRRVMEDHDGLNLLPVAVETPDGHCFMVLSIKRKHDDYMTHEVMYVGDRALFGDHARHIADSLLPQDGAVMSVDRRLVPPGTVPDRSEKIPVPRYYSPGAIAETELDNLYSEIVLLDLKLY